MTEQVVVVVVGAGPAGMHAALTAADAGATVLVVDNAPSVGGQYHRQLPATFHAQRPANGHHGWKGFAAIRDRIASHPRITHLADTEVWAIEQIDGGHRLRLQTGAADAPRRRTFSVDTPALVLATGAHDRVLPFPGWDLPGVFTAGAAQALAKGQRIAVGTRVLVAGSGPFLLPVAESLHGVDAEVVAVLEANSPAVVGCGWLAHPGTSIGKLGEAAAYVMRLARHRVPMRFRSAVIAAHGQNSVEAVTTARLDRDWNPVPGSERRVDVGAVCVGYGFTARLELAVAAGCTIGTGPDGGAAVVVDDRQRTSVRGVLAAGEITGIGGADRAAAEGTLAGLTAAAIVGRTVAPSRSVLRAVAAGNRLASALAAAYPLRGGWRRWLTDDTTICRCEEVTAGQLRQAASGLAGLGTRALKLTSRAGLGLCQGRICGYPTTALAATWAAQPGRRADQATTPQPAADHAGASRRPVAVPIRLGDLAATADSPTEEP